MEVRARSGLSFGHPELINGIDRLNTSFPERSCVPVTLHSISEVQNAR